MADVTIRPEIIINSLTYTVLENSDSDTARLSSSSFIVFATVVTFETLLKIVQTLPNLSHIAIWDTSCMNNHLRRPVDTSEYLQLFERNLQVGSTDSQKNVKRQKTRDNQHSSSENSQKYQSIFKTRQVTGLDRCIPCFQFHLVSLNFQFFKGSSTDISIEEDLLRVYFD
ncbi:hypothetical protein ACFE04_003754 [Oxalis oulophora]